MKEAVAWLARSDVRLVLPSSEIEEEKFELAHERLIPALRRLAGKQLTEADRVNQLLDRRVNEWLGNDRSARYRLTWHELRSVKKQTPFMQWEPNRSGRESLIAASWRQIRLRLALAFLPVLLAIAFASVWYSQWGQLQMIKWEVAEYSEKMTESKALAQIARAYAVMGDFPKALQVADKISDDMSIFKLEGNLKAYAFRAIVEIYAKLGEKEKVAQLLNQAILVAGKTEDKSNRASALRAIVETSAKLGEKEKDTQLLNQALLAVEKIGDEFDKAYALRAIAEASARIGEKEKTGQLLDHAFSEAEKISGEVSKVYSLQAIAEAYAKIGEKEKAAQLLSQARSLAEKVGNEDSKAGALRSIAYAYAKVEEKEEAARLLTQALSVTEKISQENSKIYSLQDIAEVYAKLGEDWKAVKLLGQALSLAEKEHRPGFQTLVFTRHRKNLCQAWRKREKCSDTQPSFFGY